MEKSFEDLLITGKISKKKLLQDMLIKKSLQKSLWKYMYELIPWISSDTPLEILSRVLPEIFTGILLVIFKEIPIGILPEISARNLSQAPSGFPMKISSEL